MQARMRLRQRMSLQAHQEQSQKEIQAFLKNYNQVHPNFPEAKTGLDGMLHANKILERTGDIGILIGGLLKESWNEYAKAEDFDRHKDVDVLVFDTKNNYRNFKGGIDWWFPYRQSGKTRWKNGQGVTLYYNLSLHPCLNKYPSGLYIPQNSDWVKFRKYEIQKINEKTLELTKENMGEISLNLTTSIGNRVASIVRDEFEGAIVPLNTFAELID